MEPENGRVEDLLLFNEHSNPDGTALISTRGSVTFRELARRAAGFAERLLQEGVRQDDRVAIFLPKTTEAVVALFGIWAAGAVAVPIHEQSRARQIAHILSDSQSATLVSNSRYLKRAGLQQTDAQLVRVDDNLTADFIPSRPAEGGENPAAILYTSGSSDLRKGFSFHTQTSSPEQGLSAGISGSTAMIASSRYHR